MKSKWVRNVSGDDWSTCRWDNGTHYVTYLHMDDADRRYVDENPREVLIVTGRPYRKFNVGSDETKDAMLTYYLLTGEWE